jgi:hypothetical protein
MTQVRRFSLQVRRFFVPILSWHRPYLYDDYTSDLPSALKRFRSTFISAALFGLTRDLTTILTDVNNVPYKVSSIALDSVFTGLELSAFPLINSVFLSQFRPALKSPQTFLAWTAATGFATALVIHTVQVPILSAHQSGKFSLKGWANDLGPARIVKFTAFTTASYGLDRVLPLPERMGGSFARSAAVMALAEVVGTVAAGPLSVPKGESLLAGRLRRGLIGLPLTLLDYTMYTGIAAGCNRWLPTQIIGKQ